MGTSSEQGPGTALTKGAATDAIISASCRYNGAGRHRPWHWQTCVYGVCVCVSVWRACVGYGKAHVCVCTVRLMEHDGGEVDYRGDYNFLVTLVWAPLHPCMHACICAYAIWGCIWLQPTWPCLVTVRQLDQSPITCLEFRGIGKSTSHLVPNFNGCYSWP